MIVSAARLFVCIFAILFLLTLPMVAQTNVNEEQGLKPYDALHGGDLDSVSLTNGGLMLHIPLASFPQRGNLDLSFYVTFSAKQWRMFIPPGHAQSSWSPSGTLGAQVVSSADWLLMDDPGNPNGTPDTLMFKPAVASPDGNLHKFGRFDFTADCPAGQLNLHSVDATGILRLDCNTVITPNGTRYNYVNGLTKPSPVNSAFAVEVEPATVTDANGNRITVGSAGWTDTMGRLIPGSVPSASFGQPLQPGVPTTDLSNCPSGTASALVWNVPGVANINNGVRTFKFCYSLITVSTSFQTGALEYGPTPTPLLTAIVLPDLTMWTFTYDNYADVTRVGFPTGGSLSYQYVINSRVPRCGGSTLRSLDVTTRTVDANDGSGGHAWSYSYANGQTKVTSPEGNDTVHTIADPVPNAVCSLMDTQVQSYQGSAASGTLLKTVATQYSGALSGFGPFDINVVPINSTVTWPGGLSSHVANTYDAGVINPDSIHETAIFGSLLQKDEYDFSNSLARSTLTHYLWQDNATYLNNNFLSPVASTTVKDGAGNQVAQSTYGYDQTAVSSSGVTTQLVTPPAGGNIRGNQTTASRWLNPGNTFVSATAAYLDSGMKAASADPLGHSTSYTYSSTFMGAYMTQTNLSDTQMPDTGAPIVHHVISGNYDFNTGLLTSFTDENSHSFSYQYDVMLRLTQGNHPDGGQTAFSYPDTLTVNRQRLISTSPSAVWDNYTAKFDGLGRSIQAQQVTPSGTALTDTTYDVMGRTSTVSNPYYQGSAHGSDPTYGITQSQYDALNRVIKTIKQDGSFRTAAYNQAAALLSAADCTVSTDESGRQRKTCVDALGRLVEVDEPNPGAAPTSATGSVTIGGTEQQGNTQPGTPGTATITIGGKELGVPICTPSCHTLWDHGTVTITVAGFAAKTINYGQGDTPATVAYKLSCAFHNDATGPADASCPVSAGTSTAVSLTARTTGTVTNYSFTTSSATLDSSGNFTGPSFTAAPASGAFTGGTNGANTPADTGTVTITVNGTPYSTTYGSSDTSTTIAGRLATAVSAGTVANAVASGGTVSLTSKTAGSAGNYTLAASYTFDTTHYTNPSFTTSASGAKLTGGYDFGALNNNPYITLYTYDTLNNLLCVEQHGAITGTGCSANPTSDAGSAWRVRRFTYDSMSRLLTATNRESGMLTYVYDNNGNVTSKIEPKPNVLWGSAAQTVTVTYTYDALNRLLDVTYSDGTTQNASYRYDYLSFLGQTFTNPIGRQVSATAAGNTIKTFTSYDVMGRVTQTVECIPGVSSCNTSTASYDLLGDLLNLGYPGSTFAVTYQYDSAARLIKATDSSGNVYAQTPTILASGAMQEFVSPNFNNYKFHTDYNSRLQPVEIWTGSAQGAGALFDKTYQYNPAGLSQVNNGNIYTVTNVKDDTRTQSFGYDALNRLLQAGDKTHWGNSYVYDPWGNLLQKNPGAPAGETLLKTADANNHLSGLLYDEAGNTTNDGFNSYTFDGENRIVTVGASVSYTYDAAGQRIKKSVSSTVTNYWYGPGGQVLTETDGSGAITNYVFFGGQRLARNISGDIKYYVTDHLHSTAVFADKSGTVLDDNDFYPWGGVVPNVGFTTSMNHYKFTGKERDAESQLDDFGARYYSNIIGRFMSPDWAGKPTAIPYSELADPQSLNLYSYVRNSPIVRVDPDGHSYAGMDGLNRSKGNDMTSEQFMGGSSSSNTMPTLDDGKATKAMVDQSKMVAGTIVDFGPRCICQGGMGPTKPPMPVPGAPDAKWVWTPDGGNGRGGRYEPDNWDYTKGPIPGASWEHVGKRQPGEPGHWDVDDGNGRQRYDRWGNPITPEQAHKGPNAKPSPFSGLQNFWDAHKVGIIVTGAVAVVVALPIIIGTVGGVALAPALL